ncbi:MAG: 50S ribosomal protein L4 [Halanaeroarchaeum sp.]
MQATVRDLDGDDAGSVELPAAFETPHRPDLVRRAVLAAQANRKQDHGADEFAGMRTPAESPGSGRGMAHVPRVNGRAARVPQAVGGRRAHPPKVEKDRTLTVNTKERKAAVSSAIAATADADLVAERGHRFDEDLELPLVVSDDFEDLVKTKEVVSFLEAIGAYEDVERADDGRSVRAGQGKLRGRKYRTPSSLCIVTSSETGPSKAARNLPGVTVATGAAVSAEDLAPGGEPGRLTVWTESALAEVAER